MALNNNTFECVQQFLLQCNMKCRFHKQLILQSMWDLFNTIWFPYSSKLQVVAWHMEIIASNSPMLWIRFLFYFYCKGSKYIYHTNQGMERRWYNLQKMAEIFKLSVKKFDRKTSFLKRAHLKMVMQLFWDLLQITAKEFDHLCIQLRILLALDVLKHHTANKL